MDIFGTLMQGLPVLIGQFAATLGLLGIGLACYTALTPFHEQTLVRDGNVAGGIVVFGTFMALAIPLAANLASSVLILDIVLWGLVALAIQLLTFMAATALIRGLREMIEGGNVAAALVLIGIQIAVALLNAGAMAG
ncbi:MAG: DUF350 domain-containing protein [Gemmatimonadaceae bacterium]|nr:DUF350 domain-containing protein [Acetobacteraceae bacterium]